MTFDSSQKFSVLPTGHSPIRDVPYEMSPVTNLAMNLSELTTSKAGTPCRRISWSNPFPDSAKIDCASEDMLSYTDSPTFQENSKMTVFQNKSRKKTKLFKEVHSIQFQCKNDSDKENLTPNIVMKQNLFGCLKKSATETVSDSDSQDSGYSGCSSQSSNVEEQQDSRTSLRSTLFASEDIEDGFDNIFEINCLDDDDFSAMPNSMTSLLTKPISSMNESPNNLSTSDLLENVVKKVRLPARRCLSMEIDADCSTLASPLTSLIKPESRKLTLTSSPMHETDNEDSKISSLKKCTFKRPEPPIDYFKHCKRRKSSPSHIFPDNAFIKSFVFQRSYSETSATIMCAVQKSDLQPELIGDCSKSFALPLVKGKHQDLRSISTETLVNLIDGKFKNEVQDFTLVDCRYPYEFEAGHIQGAMNIFTREDVLEHFLSGFPSTGQVRNIIIFHCEFSSERAPSLCRFLRNKDREKNESKYPQLHQPEVYILDGGYKAFFEEYKEYCEPQDYKPMAHKDHGSDLRQFRAKSKSWGGDSRGRTKLRTGSRI